MDRNFILKVRTFRGIAQTLKIGMTPLDSPGGSHDYGLLRIATISSNEGMRIWCIILFFCLIESRAYSDVQITQKDDGFEVKIDDELFTKWETRAWTVPYLYPVVGPDGKNITRHYPMRSGVEGESQDHPHHRSIRFSHRDVNGASFWSPDRPQNGLEAKIDLLGVEKMESGRIGELVLVNSWKIDGREILEEKVRLTFIPLENREVLMDYDVSLTAKEDVTFRDNKDGGMGMRVASTMVVQHRDTGEGKGTIVNSNGDRDAAAWGKRAKWADYSGPGYSGKTVGIALFDHPSNFRHPVHWHARTYGLMTANRFGTGHFEAKQGAKMGDGDHTIKQGETLTLRHRFFFHHGDAESAGVAGRYEEYVKD